MKNTLLTALGSLTILLVIVLIGFDYANRIAGLKLQAQQDTLQQGQLGQEIGGNLVRDIAVIAVQENNDELRDLLTKYGFNIQVQDAQ